MKLKYEGLAGISRNKSSREAGGDLQSYHTFNALLISIVFTLLILCDCELQE